jgi:fructose-specific phosphotransferase system IIC component
VIVRRPYRAVGAVLAVMALTLLVAAMVGQHGEGPWGGLPDWVGPVSWFSFLGSSVVMLALSAFLVVANLRHRSARRAAA